MGLIQTAMLTGGGLYAVNKIAKTTESRRAMSGNYNNNGATYQQQRQGNFEAVPPYSQQYIQQPPYYSSGQNQYYEPPQAYMLDQNTTNNDLATRERDLAMRERNFQMQMQQRRQQEQQCWYPADTKSQHNVGYSQTPPPYTQQEYYGRQENVRNGLQETVAGLAGQFLGGRQGKK